MPEHVSPDDSAQPTAGRRTPRRRRSRLTTLLTGIAAVAVLLVVASVVAGGVYAHGLASTYDTKTTKLSGVISKVTSRGSGAASGATASPTATPTTTNTAMNILLMGSDSRGAATSIDSTAPSNQRTDTMMLVHIDADRKAVYVMSIMRDLWVPIPGHGTHKLNAAFAYGGAALTVQTVEQLVGVHIDHLAIMDFDGFSEMTDALGGVDVVSPQAFSNDGASFAAGPIHLDGYHAIRYVRSRYPFPDGDYTRVKLQQGFLQSILTRVVSASTLTDPAKLSDFVTAMSKYLTVDDGFTSGTIVSLGLSLRDMPTSGVHYFTIPTNGTATAADGESIVNMDPAAMPALQAALSGDTMPAYAPAN